MKNRKKKIDAVEKNRLVRLYEDNNEALYRYAYRHLSDPGLSEECVSEVFTRYLQRMQNGFHLNGNSKAYLYRIAHNWIVDYYRKRKPDENLTQEPLPDPKTNPEVLFNNTQMHEKLRKELLNLPEEQRMVIELRVMEEWSHEDVAEYLDKTVEASRALQYRALKNLRQLLDSTRT